MKNIGQEVVWVESIGSSDIDGECTYVLVSFASPAFSLLQGKARYVPRSLIIYVVLSVSYRMVGPMVVLACIKNSLVSVCYTANF